MMRAARGLLTILQNSVFELVLVLAKYRGENIAHCLPRV